MRRAQLVSVGWLTLAVAIGCGGGQPDQVQATTDEVATPAPIVVAQAPEGTAAAGGSGSSSVAGVIQFTGTAPEAEKVKMSADPVCLQQQGGDVFSEAVVANANGTLKNVFVYVKDGITGTYPTPSEPVVLDQAGCWYAPHVFGIQVNQSLDLVNSDPTLHNVNAKPTVNRAFNVAQPVQGMTTSKTFTKPEVMVSFKCNVHPWMSAYAGVMAHPFYSVSDDTGAFAISGLPAGTYTIEAWHEVYGTQTQSVTVGDGASEALTFTFQ